ncbi:YceI family protein [Cecembia rubra]|uniref:YceI family protein n=1 Tax=Cecembia rubra TaxID=1485585 RepID=UPI002714E951|nr:YceI family protein [Cecembia rubra]
MMTRKKWISAIMVIILISVQWSVEAQVKYILAPSPELKVEGGSSLHDWDMTSNAAKGEGQFIIEGNQFKGIRSLQVSMEAESLKSGTKGLDANAYKALDTKKNKEVKFTLKELTGSGNSYQVKGDFTIAGVTKPASFPVKVTQNGNRVTFEGSYNTKLTDYSIDPPTALLGTVKTRDEITIKFKTTFQPNN